MIKCILIETAAIVLLSCISAVAQSQFYVIPVKSACPACPACPACTSKIVFITSVSYKGNLGGLSGADQKCQNLANIAGLTGQFKAWLSDTTASPASRFGSIKNFYTLVDGTVVAPVSWRPAALTNAINRDENGKLLVGKSVWSATDADGNYIGVPTATITSNTCTNWNLSAETPLSRGANGKIDSIQDEGWTTLTNPQYIFCNLTSHLYCFEQ